MAREQSRTPRGIAGGGASLSDEEISSLVMQREQARMAKDFASADSLREQLGTYGVTLFDKTQTWKAADGRTGRIPTFAEIAAGEEGHAPEHLQQEVVPPAGGGGEDVAQIKHLVGLREQARAEKDWAQSDRIRDDLKAMGVELLDKEKIWKSKSGHMGIIVGYRGSAGPSDHEIKILVAFREKSRQNEDYQTSDMIREELRAYGVDLNDKMKVWRSPEGREGAIPTWNLGVPAPPAAMRVGGGFAPPMAPQQVGYGGVQAGPAGDMRQQLVQAALQAAHNPATAQRTLQLLQTVGGGAPPPTVGRMPTAGAPHVGHAGYVGFQAPVAPPARPTRLGGVTSQNVDAKEASSMVRQIQAEKREPVDAEIEMLVALREKVRQAKDFGAADELREAFRLVGIELQEKEKRWTTKDGRVGAIPLWSSLV